MVSTILSISFILIALYLVLMHASEFQTASSAVGSLFGSSVGALQGR